MTKDEVIADAHRYQAEVEQRMREFSKTTGEVAKVCGRIAIESRRAVNALLDLAAVFPKEIGSDKK